MPNTFTLSGTLLDGQNNPIVNKYVRFRVTSVGTDTEDGAVYPRDTFDFKTDASGDLQGTSGSNTVWINGDSGVQCYYEISLPKGQKVDVVIPSAVEGTTVSLDDIIENYQVDGSTQQSTTLASAKAYTDVLADDPTNNVSFNAANWQDAVLPTPTDSNFLVGDGTNWVGESGATARTSLGIGTSDTPIFDGVDLNTGRLTLDDDGDTYIQYAVGVFDEVEMYVGGSQRFFLGAIGDNAITGDLLITADLDVSGSAEIAGGFFTSTTLVDSIAYNAQYTDSVILADDGTAGAEITINLPSTTSARDGFQLVIKKIGNTANVVIDGSGSDTIDGATTATLTTQYESVKLICDGSNWHII